MSDFLTHLAARTLGLGNIVRPRVAALFEPPGAAEGGRLGAVDGRATPGVEGAMVAPLTAVEVADFVDRSRTPSLREDRRDDDSGHAVARSMPDEQVQPFEARVSDDARTARAVEGAAGPRSPGSISPAGVRRPMTSSGAPAAPMPMPETVLPDGSARTAPGRNPSLGGNLPTPRERVPPLAGAEPDHAIDRTGERRGRGPVKADVPGVAARGGPPGSAHAVEPSRVATLAAEAEPARITGRAPTTLGVSRVGPFRPGGPVRAVDETGTRDMASDDRAASMTGAPSPRVIVPRVAIYSDAVERLGARRAAPPEPTVHVTIGRVEVRATPPPAPAPARERGPRAMSLEEYLRGRAGAGR